LGRPVTEISAEWRIPTVVTSRPGEAATWIGAEGIGGLPFIQLGSTEFVVGNHKAAYRLFWSDPAQAYNAVDIATLKRPGDLIMFEMIKSTDGWNVVVKDRTAGWTRSVDVQYQANEAYDTGEWVDPRRSGQRHGHDNRQSLRRHFNRDPAASPSRRTDTSHDPEGRSGLIDAKWHLSGPEVLAKRCVLDGPSQRAGAPIPG